MKRESFPSSDAAVVACPIHLLHITVRVLVLLAVSVRRFISPHRVLDSTMHGANLRRAIKQPTAWATFEGGSLVKMRGTVPKRYSTSTLIDSASCVPWLAAEGPLAYTPENPPATDYFFQYSWILPEIFDFKVHKRCHHYFGTPIRDHAKPLFEFWRQARRREVDRVYLSLGAFTENRLCAPVAVYRAKLCPHDESDQWLFIQHGSYQWISSADQPHVEDGHVLLYRGVQREKMFRYRSLERDLQQLANHRSWNRYHARPLGGGDKRVLA